jgi:hypothetical protein
MFMNNNLDTFFGPGTIGFDIFPLSGFNLFAFFLLSLAVLMFTHYFVMLQTLKLYIKNRTQRKLKIYRIDTRSPKSWCSKCLCPEVSKK